MLKSFHPNIKFTYESECNSRLPVLHVMLCRYGKNIITTMYRKVTNNDAYLNYNAFSPESWRRGILKILLSKVRTTPSELLRQKSDHQEKLLVELSNFPK